MKTARKKTKGIQSNRPPLKVEVWDINRLQPYRNNARRHSPAQIEKIRGSMREFGWTIPVLARKDGTLIAGHGRYEAGLLEGFTEVPVIVAEGWSEEQCRAYTITDNRLSEASEWDDEILKIELGELQTTGFDLSLTGFDDADLAKLIQIPEIDDASAAADGSADEPAELKRVIQFNIVFDDEYQQEAWFAFVRQLKARYPDEETLGARLARHLVEVPADAAS